MKKSFKGYVVLVSICSLIAIGGLLNIVDVKNTNKSEDVVLVFFLLFWIAFGLYKIVKIQKSNSKIKNIEKMKSMENEILKIIKFYNGKVTLIEVAEKSSFTINEVEEFLKEMCSKGLGNINITDSGSCVYVFDGFLSKNERDSSHSIFDN